MSQKTNIKQRAACKAIDKAGGATSLAETLTARLGKSVKRDRVQRWKVTGVPPRFCRHVEAVTGISRYTLDPETFGPKKDACACCSK